MHWEDWKFGLESNTWWTVGFFLANGVLIGRRGYVFYVEEGLSASKKFALRARSLPYITVWFVLALATIALGFMSDDFGEALGVTGVLIGEFVAVCLWDHYYGNSELVANLVEETRKRLDFLLTHGLGMNATESEKFWLANETAIVELWMKYLKTRTCHAISADDLDQLLFDTGVETGKMMADHLWEGVLYDVAAYMHEWYSEVEDLRQPVQIEAGDIRNAMVVEIESLRGNIRVPKKVKEELILGNDADSQALLCVAVLVANEDAELRRLRAARNTDPHSRQFSAARIARRKTAAEGILRWPDCVANPSTVEIRSLEWNPAELEILDKSRRLPCYKEDIPHSVLYTIVEAIKAGYLRMSLEGNAEVTITFKYGNMVFKKDDWNQQGTIERRPFRYITSATWMAGDVAFVVEQRELTGAAAALDGSGFLNGKLTVVFNGTEKREKLSWVERSSTPKTECNETSWGVVEDLVQPKCICLLNKPTIWAIRATWRLFSCIRSLFKCSANAWQKHVRQGVAVPEIVRWTAERIRKPVVDTLLQRESRRDMDNAIQQAADNELRTLYGSGSGARAGYSRQEDDRPQEEA